MPLPLRQCVIAIYCRGDEGFDAAVAEIAQEDRGKPGGITDQDEVFSVIKGLGGQDKEFTIILTVVDPKPAASLPQRTATRALTRFRRPSDF